MQATKLSLPGKLDTGLTKGFCVLLGWLKKGGLWLFGLLTLALLPWMIFEYDEGIADLSWLECGFMLLSGLLLWRHIHYCRHFSTGAWQGLSRLLMFQGSMGVIQLVAVGTLTSLLVDTEYMQAFLNYLRQEDPVSKCVSFGMVLLAVYLATPITTTEGLPEPDVILPPVEPMEFETAKEASL